MSKDEFLFNGLINSELQNIYKTFENPAIQKMRKDMERYQNMIMDTRKSLAKVNPIAKQWDNYRAGVLPRGVNFLTDKQIDTLRSTNKWLSGANTHKFPKKLSFLTDQQLEMLNLSKKGFGTAIPNIPRVALFTPKQQRMLQSIGKGLNIGLNRLPKTRSLFTEEQQKILESATRGLNLQIKDLPTIASFLTPIQRDMLKPLGIGLNRGLASSHVTIPVITVDDFAPYWEDEEVQEAIAQEFASIENVIEEENQTLLEYFNNLATNILDFPTTLRQKSPLVYVMLVVFLWISSFMVAPVIQDIIKEKVFHLSTFLEDKPKEQKRTQIKKYKESVVKNDEVAAEFSYKDAEQAMTHVRITNRLTAVYRSEKRKSGVIDNIQPNKAVIILYKKRNWSLVLYRNSLNEEVNGWVFTKNLTK